LLAGAWSLQKTRLYSFATTTCVVESMKPRIFIGESLHLQYGHLINGVVMQGETYEHLIYLGSGEYNKRSLSYDNDSSNALLWVLHQCETRLAKTKKPITFMGYADQRIKYAWSRVRGVLLLVAMPGRCLSAWLPKLILGRLGGEQTPTLKPSPS
jgi:hypothetical protein